MSNIDKQALRTDAVRAGGGKWIYIRTLSLSKAYITEETGATVINCTDGDVPAKCAGFLASANPATVLALLDELEAAEKRIAELEAVKCNFSDSKLLSLAKDIVENLVDTGGSDPEYTKQYIDWTCKRIRIAAAVKGE